MNFIHHRTCHNTVYDMTSVAPALLTRSVIVSGTFCRDKDKKKGKKGDADEGSGGDSPGTPGDEGAADADKEDEVVWMTDTSAKAAEERAQQQLTKAMADMVTQVS